MFTYTLSLVKVFRVYYNVKSNWNPNTFFCSYAYRACRSRASLYCLHSPLFMGVSFTLGKPKDRKIVVVTCSSF